jgi:hypothetical protein
VIRPPAGTNPFEFIVVSGQRAAQLMRGCIPRVAVEHKVISTAQLEVATGKVVAMPHQPPTEPAPAATEE